MDKRSPARATDADLNMPKKILAFASIVEVATGLALIADPRFVVGLLVGPSTPAEEIPMGQFPGIAILALGLACWPAGQQGESGASAIRGMLVYNLRVTLFPGYLYTGRHPGGVLSWRCC